MSKQSTIGRTLSGLMLMISVSAIHPGCSMTKQNNSASTDLGVYEGVEFEMPKVNEPTFPEYSVSILEFGANGDGQTDNSSAFEQAISKVAEKGGGKVIVPRGIYLTGPITMKSNINLHVSDGAVILFSKNFDDYPLISTSFEGLDTYRCMSPIHAHDLKNIAITGNGVIDGNGDAWRPVKKGKLTDTQWKKLVKSGGVLSENGKIWYPSAKSRAGDSNDNFNVPDFNTKEEHEAVKDYLRPVLVSIKGCDGVLLDGPTFQNSPAWNLHPLMSENIILRNLTIRNPWYSQNGDGLDLESCKNVLVYNNSFDVGDDAICFKSGKDEDGRKRGIPTENVIVKNNIVYHGHGGFVLGSEMSGGVRNVHVSACTFMGTDIGLRFKSTRGRGGVVENIYISDIDMLNIPAEPIRFNMFYGGQSPVMEDGKNSTPSDKKAEVVPVTEETPCFKNIFMKNIRANGFGNAAFFMGLPEMNLENVHLENAVIKGQKGITIIDADGITLKNVVVKAENGPALQMHNGKNIEIEEFDYDIHNPTAIDIYGPLTHKVNITLTNKEINNSISYISNDVTKNEITIN